MTWKWAAFLPHPPIIVPGVGRGRERDAQATIDGVRDVTRKIREAGRVETILLLSPHQRWAHGALAVNTARTISGSLAHFGARDASFELSAPLESIEALTSHARERGARVVAHDDPDLSSDQGSTVPLYFLRDELGELPEVILASPIGLDRAASCALGRAIADFDCGRDWGLLASGDLSHRLVPGGSNGYSPSGQVFDDAVVESIKNITTAPVMALTEDEIDAAGECGMRSALVMIGMLEALGMKSGDAVVSSYEGPYGVGYCTALCRTR